MEVSIARGCDCTLRKRDATPNGLISHGVHSIDVAGLGRYTTTPLDRDFNTKNMGEGV